MKLRFLTLLGLTLVFAGLNSCSKNDPSTLVEQGISAEVKAKINALGFDATDAVMTDEGYVVEGDIFLSFDDLNKPAQIQLLNVPDAEQFRTTNLVTALPRTITVYIKTGNSGNNLPVSYGAGLDVAISRYNAESLTVTFQRVYTTAADIDIVKANGNYLASAGFPTSGGDPYGTIKVNSGAIGNNPAPDYLGTILAHEMGHCIGFRHTDYMDRSYSCGGSFYNEGDGGVGAINIPGTPTGPDSGSWMLSCISAGQSRPFNANDKTALNYLY